MGDNAIPNGVVKEDWEVPATLNHTWGFKKDDTDWKSPEDLTFKLVDIASKGGNYLLNVGPTSDGVIPEPSVERLKEIGAWMKVNGDSIYATTASPFEAPLPWGRCTKKIAKNSAELYLHVFDWPTNGKLLLPGLISEAKSASLLAGGQKLTTQNT